jgi:hypothetical protein
MTRLRALVVLYGLGLGACSSGPGATEARLGAPMSTTLTRWAFVCPAVIMEAPFDSRDSYYFAVDKFTIDGEGVYGFYITTRPSVPLGQDLVVPLGDLVGVGSMPTFYGQTGEIPLSAGTLKVEWYQDVRADPVLAGPVTVRVSSFPATDGDLIRVRIEARLTDGSRLDLEASAPLVSPLSLTCPVA